VLTFATEGAIQQLAVVISINAFVVGHLLTSSRVITERQCALFAKFV
tara:strand:- start:812 stop:952 length:141 start_codon:yes stop_codon:yes gene_type:complete